MEKSMLGTSRDRRQNRPGKAKPDTFARVQLNQPPQPSQPLSSLRSSLSLLSSFPPHLLTLTSSSPHPISLFNT